MNPSSDQSIHNSNNELEKNILFEIKFKYNYWKVLIINHLFLSSILVLLIVGLLYFPLLPFVLVNYYIIYKNRKCYVTNDYIYLSQDTPNFFLPFLKNHIERTIPLQKITDITITQNWVERMFGFSEMKIETAGNSNTIQNGVAMADLVLSGIEESLCKNYKHRILNLVSNRFENNNISFNNHSIETEPNLIESSTNFGNELMNVLNDIKDTLKRIENRQNTNVEELA